MQYSEGFRLKMVRRMLGPDGLTATSLAAKSGVSQQTLSRWLRDAVTLAGMTDGGEKTPPSLKSPKEWTPEEKLRVVFAAAGLEGEELGALLRREGVHTAQLEEWRRAALHGARERLAGAAPGPRGRGDRKRVRELERELARKEKALAEVTALLVLKKKAEALWGPEGPERDDEDDLSDEKTEK